MKHVSLAGLVTGISSKHLGSREGKLRMPAWILQFFSFLFFLTSRFTDPPPPSTKNFIWAQKISCSLNCNVNCLRGKKLASIFATRQKQFFSYDERICEMGVGAVVQSKKITPTKKNCRRIHIFVARSCVKIDTNDTFLLFFFRNFQR